MEPVGRWETAWFSFRDAIVATANQCKHLAGVWVDGNQRDLWIGDGTGFFALGSLMLLAHDLVDVPHADLYSFRGGALQFGVERSVNSEALVGQVLVADALDELIMDKVDKVRGLRWRRYWGEPEEGAPPWPGPLRLQ